jgi:hypothetical protein
MVHCLSTDPKQALCVGVKKPQAFAVLMGDIVGSERSPAIRAVYRAFNKAVDSANKKHAAQIASPLTITLGDEFQGLLRSLAHAWDIAVTLRIQLLVAHVPCRFVIGAAELETPLNTKQAWNMMGGGLSAARDKLNDKRSSSAYRFSLPGEPIVESLMDGLGDALTAAELDWTATQLRYYSESRESESTSAELANRLGITARSLYKVLHAARADFHKRQSEVLRSALAALDQRYGLQ